MFHQEAEQHIWHASQTLRCHQAPRQHRINQYLTFQSVHSTNVKYGSHILLPVLWTTKCDRCSHDEIAYKYVTCKKLEGAQPAKTSNRDKPRIYVSAGDKLVVRIRLTGRGPGLAFSAYLGNVSIPTWDALYLYLQVRIDSATHLQRHVRKQQRKRAGSGSAAWFNPRTIAYELSSSHGCNDCLFHFGISCCSWHIFWPKPM